MNYKEEKILTEMIQQEFDLGVVMAKGASLEELRQLLIDKIAFLLNHDFERLVQVLYRIDISEQKVKEALTSNTDSSETLADLIIERQWEKAKTKSNLSKDNEWKE